ncbi:hypothetical protein EVAR_26580_1 [Eumeta japonica]|uniref:Uncharacterized protein n=1 Tax=Eumeta variegata TaxID=151549 RepID=A0A4C1W7L9_EUMVA|nr:hypothetical protein EVAR_26580_1 [Eumeta japonica]
MYVSRAPTSLPGQFLNERNRENSKRTDGPVLAPLTAREEERLILAPIRYANCNVHRGSSADEYLVVGVQGAFDRQLILSCFRFESYDLKECECGFYSRLINHGKVTHPQLTYLRISNGLTAKAPGGGVVVRQESVKSVGRTFVTQQKHGEPGGAPAAGRDHLSPSRNRSAPRPPPERGPPPLHTKAMIGRPQTPIRFRFDEREKFTTRRIKRAGSNNLIQRNRLMTYDEIQHIYCRLDQEVCIISTETSSRKENSFTLGTAPSKAGLKTGSVCYRMIARRFYYCGQQAIGTGLSMLLVHHDNASAHLVFKTRGFLHSTPVKLIDHPPCSIV